MTRQILAALLALSLTGGMAAARSPRRDPGPGSGAVSAADPRAAEAGREILRAGGSAADAAIAMMLALNVVEPQSSGIGGGGFFVYHDAKSGRIDSFDGREAAPAAAGPRWFYAPDGTPLSHADAVPGGRSVGVPGNLRLAALVHARHGRLPWARLFAPAIRLARDGVAITPRLQNSLTFYGGQIQPGWARAHYFAADGTPRPVGTVLKNPELAGLLERIAAHGPNAFYHGVTARALIETVDRADRNPSRMTAADLAGYAAHERPVLCGRYRVYRICGMGPPSSGAIAVFAILKQLERFDLAALGKDSPVAWHLIAESERLAYADRDAYLGDTDHVAVPIAGLMDPAYLAGRGGLIAADRTIAHVVPGTPRGAPPRLRAPAAEVPGTTHFVAVDAQGDVASETSTIESPFGSGLTVSGLFLNNELTDFDIVPDKDGALVPNRVEGGKRPRSSMSPTIVYGPDGQVRIALGAAGGATIIAQIAKTLIAVLDWRLSAQDAIALPLLFAPGDTALLEKDTALAAMAPALERLGQKILVAPLGLKANAIERVGGRWRGAADPRSEGVWLDEGAPAAAAIRRVRRAPGTPSE